MAMGSSSYYDGSKIFSWLADYVGISVDQLNFVISQFVALALASLFRTFLHPSKTNSGTRHGFGLIFGLIIGYFCFGMQAIHLAGLPALCYIIIRTQSPKIMQRMVLAVSLIYLSCIHLHRQIYDYGSYTLDITGPLMVITQKVTSLAFSIHDGFTRNDSELTQNQKFYAVHQLPSPLEFFSYMLAFPALMAGPVLFYKDYMEFIDGANLIQKPASINVNNNSNSQTVVLEPSPCIVVYKKVALSCLCAFIFVTFLPMFPIEGVKEDDFVENSSTAFKFWYLGIATLLVRFKYYFAWIFADAICNNAGIGFNGYNLDGSSRWDRFSNIKILKFEKLSGVMDEFCDNLDASSETIRMITVKFSTPDGKVFTQSYDDQTLIKDIKRVLADVFILPFESIIIMKDGHTVCDYKRLEQFSAGDYNILEFGIASAKPSRFVLAGDAYELDEIPDIITVHVEDSDEEEGYRDVVVEIIDRKIEKPFLGGYVHKEHGTEYHHGYSQTGPCKPKVGPENQTHRDTQTYFWRNRLLDTKYARATQMSCSDVWIPNVTDRIMTSMPYETAEEREKRLDVEGKVRTIQRYFRAWKIRKGLKIVSAEYKKRIFLEQEMIKFDLEDDENRKKCEIIGKVFPRTKYDFFMLYTMVDRWKKAEIRRISNTYSGSAKITAFYVLLDKEVEMLRAIENHRKNIKKDKKIEKERDFFETIKNPVAWNIYYKDWMEQYKDIHVEMDTLETQKGREYYNTFLSITNSNVDVNYCFEALLNVKLSLLRHNCRLSNEFVSLIDRACELMARGFTSKQLDVLMKRIQGLLLKHIQDPICNNNVTKRLLNLQERLMKGNLFYCSYCRKLKPYSSFALHTSTDKFGVCLSCSWNNRIIQPWFDLAPYRYMLRWIRRKEQMENTPSLVPFILQDQDIHYIVTNIWHGHSAISEYNDVYNLRLCRWFRNLPWAPWNCILLTVKESEAHLKIEDLKIVYDGHFLCRVFNKHELAKSHFKSVIKLEQHYRQINKCNGEWNEIKEIVSDEFIKMFN